MITVSIDKTKLDIPFIQSYLKDAYWAKNRTIEMVQTSIENSICFGIYWEEKQIGFARVISDLVSIAYLTDVFIVENFRGNGYSSILMNSIMKEPQLQDVKIWGLATLDTHFLYKKFGFNAIENLEKLMEKIIQ